MPLIEGVLDRRGTFQFVDADGTTSAHQILSTLFTDQPNFLKGLDDILQRLEFGLPAKALPLTKLPVPLTRGQYLALVNVGASTPDDVNALSDERLRECVGAAVATQMRPKRGGEGDSQVREEDL